MKQKLSVTLDPDLVEMIKRKAKEDERTFSQEVAYLIKVAFSMVPVPPSYDERLAAASFDPDTEWHPSNPASFNLPNPANDEPPPPDDPDPWYKRSE
jgi:hypothetical protein